ncbi:MAG TPA: NADH-quinone oxidoreductase subunit D [Acidilobales archaeon]|nr:NADH-quinone oxidoreductase subunit D [Acidilobales archaeon]
MNKSTYVEIPVGPQHPALHEPLLLRVKVDGEAVVDVQVITGYNHRGIEKLGERNTWIQNAYLYGRVCGICNTVHAQAYVQCVEEIGGIQAPPRANYLRTLVMELERIHSHMLITAVMAELTGFDTLFMLLMRDRERIMWSKEIVTGNRVLADYIIPGGVKWDVNKDKLSKILKVLDFIEERMKYYKKVIMEDSIINKRWRGIGIIRKDEALEYCLVGPTVRGSGVKTDIRKDDPYAAYGELDFELITYDEGDVWSRMMVRVDEIFESINMIRQIIKKLPDGPIAGKALPRVIKPGEAISRVEAPRGELVYHIISKGGQRPYRVKVRTPSFSNILNGVIAYRNSLLADVPVILGSFDPCISCMERLIVYDVRKNVEKVVPIRKLIRKGVVR